MDDARSPSSPPLHVVICPWLAFGHILPYLELAERLASRGHRVSFLSTPKNLARLPARRHADTIDLVTLPLPRVEGLPEGAESTNDVPGDRLEPLFEAFDGLAAPFAEFLSADEGNRPRQDWIVADTLTHWAATVALQHKVPCAMLVSSAAVISAFACGARDCTELAAASIFEQPASVAVEEPPAGMPRYEWKRNVTGLFTPHEMKGMSVVRRITLALESCTITAIRSCPEWEPVVFSHAAALLGKPLGLLPPSPDGGRGAGMNRDDATVRWLDAQPPKSVVYVALGSEVPLRVEQVHEMAHGLEMAGARFVWAMRPPRGVPDDMDVLPPGFQERTHGHGLVTMGWVPQNTVLAHGAVGAFLTHCGRSSLIEGLLYGHPLIMLPISGDQGPNARLMEGRKVGLQVPRDEDDGSFNRKGFAKAVRAVMVEEDTRRVFVKNAMKLQEVLADKELHERYIDEFVQQLRSYTTS
ncbi:unnamed protein product [Miscanthus lutarioriparius]|uniref:Glycosyltransferase n=2 Tax=Miscanthus lutarioriparius TaxID=422564 RepID=A0A811Q682_9POAL|nr:unnamed protein product [Miscanthus lutarioriparius]